MKVKLGEEVKQTMEQEFSEKQKTLQAEFESKRSELSKLYLIFIIKFCYPKFPTKCYMHIYDPYQTAAEGAV